MRMNLEKINKVKRDKVENGIDFIENLNKNENIIDKMIVFGSSVTEECTEESDIDVCLVSDYTTANNVYFRIHGGLGRVMDDIVDVFNFKIVGDKLKNEILKKGVVVYKNSNDKKYRMILVYDMIVLFNIYNIFKIYWLTELIQF